MAGASAYGDPLFEFTEKPGPYAVGLKVVEQHDFSRTYRYLTDELGKPYQGVRARPLQTLVWYPAESGHGRAMTVRDYGNLWATETSFGKSNMPVRAKEWLSATSPTLSMPLWAVRDAPETSGRFPIVIYAPSFSSMSWENADLCEYLASHGYVVVASPSMGAMTRNMTADLDGANEQARDISFLIGYAQSLANTEASQVAVAGFSWGGVSNLFAAARDNRIAALIALDGSMRYWAKLVQDAGDVHPEEMAIPLLYFAQGEFTLEDQERYLSATQNKGPNVLNAWTHGDLVTVRLSGMTHAEFASMYQRNEEVWRDFPEWQKADYGRADGIVGYAWVARYTRQFLDAYLKHSAVAMEYLKKTPARNGAPEHFMAVNYRAAVDVPASFEELRAQIGRQGFGRAAEIYATLKVKSDFKLDEGRIDAWAQELLDSNHLTEAIALLELNVQVYPESGAARVSLGNAYQKSGQTRLAIESYRKSLEMNPINPDAKRRLRELEGSKPPHVFPVL